MAIPTRSAPDVLPVLPCHQHPPGQFRVEHRLVLKMGSGGVKHYPAVVEVVLQPSCVLCLVRSRACDSELGP